MLERYAVNLSVVIDCCIEGRLLREARCVHVLPSLSVIRTCTAAPRTLMTSASLGR